MSAETTAPAIRADLARKADQTPSVSPSELELVRATVANDATPEELKLYLYDCARQGVHPLDKLIHFTKRAGKYTPITSIDFMRMSAADTGEYAGSDDAVYGDIMGAKYPVQATVTVWRLVQGQRCAFTATARWSEYKPDQAFMWTKMPFTMLAKCAEALALRKGFPRQLAGLYAKEEMDQAGSGQVEPAIREVSSRRPRPEAPPPAKPPESDRPASALVTAAPANVNPYTGEEYPALPAVEHIAYVWKAERDGEWRHGTISQPDGTTREVRTKREVGDQLQAACESKQPVLIRVNDKGYVMTCEWYAPTIHPVMRDAEDVPF